MKKEFNELLEEINKNFFLKNDDTFIIDVNLSVYVSLELDRPAWVMNTGAASSGKTIFSSLLEGLPNVHFKTNFTANHLFSGSPNDQGGYVPREIKEKGLIIFTDFTTVISRGYYDKMNILSQLRVMYDGRAGKETGIDAGIKKEWKGKVGVISNVTEAIESLKPKISELGERFLYFKFSPNIDKDFLLDDNYREAKITDEIKVKVSQSIDAAKNELPNIQLERSMREFLFNSSSFVGQGRRAVQRDGNKKDITQVASVEQPIRVYNSYCDLFKCLLAVNGSVERSKKIIRKISFSSIPDLRMRIIAKLYNAPLGMTRKDFYSRFKESESPINRALEELELIDIVDKKLLIKKTPKGNSTKYYAYKLAQEFKELMDSLK